MKLFLLRIIKVYQTYISPFVGHQCRYYPSCSAYLFEAIKTRGVLKGLNLGFSRLLRCNPFFKGGFDPLTK